jgi:hypothetical protein
LAETVNHESRPAATIFTEDGRLFIRTSEGELDIILGVVPGVALTSSTNLGSRQKVIYLGSAIRVGKTVQTLADQFPRFALVLAFLLFLLSSLSCRLSLDSTRTFRASDLAVSLPEPCLQAVDRFPDRLP